jgi:hypothetical protein
LKRSTVASKKYIKRYKNYPKFKSKLNLVIGCVYYGNNRSNHLKLGVLMELGDKTSTLKLKDGKIVKVKNITLKSAQIGK